MAIQIPNAGTGNGATGDNEFVLWTKVINNFSDATHAASKLVGTAAGQVPLIMGNNGVLGTGIGANGTVDNIANEKELTALWATKGSRIIRNSTANPAVMQEGTGMYCKADNTYGAFTVGYAGQGVRFVGGEVNNNSVFIYDVWTNKNATKDPNGFLKGASPIAEIYSDKMDLNDDAQRQGGIAFEKLGVGDYLVKGSLGFAKEGWYIETPKDANGNVLVAVVYEQLANNDLSIKTYAKKFDDETGDVIANLLKPRDIPAGRFISLRLHELPKEPPVMPTETQPEV